MPMSTQDIENQYDQAMKAAKAVAASALASAEERRVAGETITALLDIKLESIEVSIAQKAKILAALTTRIGALSAAIQTGFLETFQTRLAEIATSFRNELAGLGEEVVGRLAGVGPQAQPTPLANGESPLAVSTTGIELIKHFEGLELQAYRDPVGIWTIGYGHTATAKDGMTVTKAEADELLRRDLRGAAADVRSAVTVTLSTNQFDALVSWTFNLGIGNLKKSTLLKVLNQGDHERVPDEMRRWTYAGGQQFDGLIRRRNAEAILWAEGRLDFGQPG